MDTPPINWNAEGSNEKRSVIANENIASLTGIRIPAQQITTNLSTSNYGAAAYIPLGIPLYMKINDKLQDRIISKDFMEMSDILVDHHPSEVDLHLAVQNKSLTIDEDEACMMEEDSSGEEFDPSFNFTLRSTAELENFQNLILKYASTCHSFNPVSYSARNLLAALDNNAHCQRQMMVNKDGSTRRYYRKTGIQRSVYAKREDKDYHHVPTIIKIIVENRLQDHVGMNRKVLLDVKDPRRVSAVLAPTLTPSTADHCRTKDIKIYQGRPRKNSRLQLD
ncbi:Hypothetical predicted protein [Mytilus galloprovincialis]|uniref:Uncharacterized protein n=1 Tax=Mytilus galloprovincialis TaxID=29158 RepID=A0A8B6FDZ8_MYTGA|nr:Hypothetical predicted protein [Mytilus galloprovincialis]